MKKTVVLITLLSTLICTEACAKFKMVASCSYETRTGMSQDYDFIVDFLTGIELNKETKTSSYKPYSNYAVIRFNDDKCAIIKIKEFVITKDGIFLPDNLKLHRTLSGYDQDNAFWKIRW